MTLNTEQSEVLAGGRATHAHRHDVLAGIVECLEVLLADRRTVRGVSAKQLRHRHTFTSTVPESFKAVVASLNLLPQFLFLQVHMAFLLSTLKSLFIANVLLSFSTLKSFYPIKDIYELQEKIKIFHEAVHEYAMYGWAWNLGFRSQTQETG